MLRKFVILLAVCAGLALATPASASTDGCVVDGSVSTTLASDHYLALGETCVFTDPANGFVHTLAMQTDTNVVYSVYEYYEGSWETVVRWQTGAIPTAAYLWMAPNGDLTVIDASYTVIWTAPRAKLGPFAGSYLQISHPPPSLALRKADGTLVYVIVGG